MKHEYATFGGGCFWCTEAVFEEVEGVYEVVSGYAGGHIVNPSYREVTSGRTGHAEVIQLKYSPEIISYEEILEIFFKTHDPTTLNRQGADVGTQYRSIVFYHNEKQEKVVRSLIEKYDNERIFDNSIVTQVEKYEHFYPAEEYHQDYFAKNPNQGYCTFVIQPKINKLKNNFSDKLKDFE